MIRKELGFGPAPPLATPFGSKEALFAGFVPLLKGTEAQRRVATLYDPGGHFPLCALYRRGQEKVMGWASSPPVSPLACPGPTAHDPTPLYQEERCTPDSHGPQSR